MLFLLPNQQRQSTEGICEAKIRLLDSTANIVVKNSSYTFVFWMFIHMNFCNLILASHMHFWLADMFLLNNAMQAWYMP